MSRNKNHWQIAAECAAALPRLPRGLKSSSACLLQVLARQRFGGKDGWSLAGTVHLMLGSCGGDLRSWTLSDRVGGWAGGIPLSLLI